MTTYIVSRYFRSWFSIISSIALYTLITTKVMMDGLSCVAGIREGGVGGINRVRSETNKQLVHKPKKASLETI